MADAIDILCKECGFSDILSKKKKETIDMVRHIIRTYEAFYGASVPTPVDVVKKALRVFLEFSPQSVNLFLTKGRELHEKALDRIVEKIYQIAEPELVKDGTLQYIS